MADSPTAKGEEDPFGKGWKDAASLYESGGQGGQQTNHMAHLQTQALPPARMLDSIPPGDVSLSLTGFI